jgi:hypothetical protein
VTLKKQKFVWKPLKPEVSSFSPSLWTCGGTVYHGRNIWQRSCSPYDNQEAKRRQKKARLPQYPFKGMSLIT